MLVLVIDADVLTDLYLDKLQLRFRDDRMPAAGGMVITSPTPTTCSLIPIIARPVP